MTSATASAFTLLDGGLSTALEQAGHDLRDPLWTARLLRDDPAAIVDAHVAYLRAGARVLITSSYQASVEGFVRAGASLAEAEALVRLPTALARRAVAIVAPEHAVRVAASVGPYGAVLGDGSEYRGVYELTDDELVAFHAHRLALVVSTEPDLLAVETIPTAAEARAIARALDETTDGRIPSWVTFTCRSGTHTWGGDPIEDAVAASLSVPGIAAVGVNCTDPRFVGALLRRIRSVADLPLVAYPNAGQGWDGEAHRWTGDAFAFGPDLVAEWVDLGASFVGGCCGVGPQAIATLGRSVAS